MNLGWTGTVGEVLDFLYEVGADQTLDGTPFLYHTRFFFLRVEIRDRPCVVTRDVTYSIGFEEHNLERELVRMYGHRPVYAII